MIMQNELTFLNAVKTLVFIVIVFPLGISLGVALLLLVFAEIEIWSNWLMAFINFVS